MSNTRKFTVHGGMLKLGWVALAAKVVFLVAFAVNTRFVMDEFWQFGQAKYLFDGLFETIWPAKAVGYAVFYSLFHSIGWDAQSMLLAGRLQTALLGCGILVMVYALARAIGEERTRAVLVVLLLLCFTTFIERVFRTRSEPLALFFGMAALLVVVRGSADSCRRLIFAGVLSGLAFLSTQKAIYFNFGLGLALVCDAAMSGRFGSALRRGVYLVAGAVLPIIIYGLVFGIDNPLMVISNLFLGPIEVATTGQNYYNDFGRFVVQTLIRNAPLYLTCFLGALLALRDIRKMEGPQRIVLVFTVIITVLVFAHNQPWPYVFIMALPFLALWAFVPYDELASRSSLQKWLFRGFVLMVAVSYVRNVGYLRHGNSEQLAVISYAESLIADDETYFDGIGMLPNRRESPRFWLDARGVYRAKTQGAESDLFRALAESPPNLIIKTYRTEALRSVLQPLLENRYIEISRNIMLPGRKLSPSENVTFDVPLAGEYGLYDHNGMPIGSRAQVDGMWRDLPVRLTAGAHAIFIASEEGTVFILPEGLSLGPLSRGESPIPLFQEVYSF